MARNNKWTTTLIRWRLRVQEEHWSTKDTMARWHPVPRGKTMDTGCLREVGEEGRFLPRDFFHHTSILELDGTSCYCTYFTAFPVSGRVARLNWFSFIENPTEQFSLNSSKVLCYRFPYIHKNFSLFSKVRFCKVTLNGSKKTKIQRNISNLEEKVKNLNISAFRLF